VPLPLPPRLSLSDPAPLQAGGMVVAAGGGAARADYASILPASAFY
jgi:hypothetical protein